MKMGHIKWISVQFDNVFGILISIESENVPLDNIFFF